MHSPNVLDETPETGPLSSSSSSSSHASSSSSYASTSTSLTPASASAAPVSQPVSPPLQVNGAAPPLAPVTFSSVALPAPAHAHPHAGDIVGRRLPPRRSRSPSTSVGELGGVARRSGLPARASSLASTVAAGVLPIEPVPGIPSFYPQSLWEDARQGRSDTDRITRKTRYSVPPERRLEVGKYVADPDISDFSNPRYRRPQRTFSREQPRLSRLGEMIGTNRSSSSSSQAPRPVYAVPISSGTAAAASDVSTSVIDDDDEYDDSDEDGSEEAVVLPALSRGARRGNAAAAQAVRYTYPVVEPAYAFSAASFYFPIHYDRPSASERADPRGLPQSINEEMHPNDRANLPLSSVSVQKNNVNRMGLYKIGPGAVAFKVVISAFEAAGLKYTPSNRNFNILWAKRATPYTLESLTPYQKVNHFPGTWGIGRKDNLAQNMTKMRRYFGDAVYDIAPPSFLYPRQEFELKSDASRHPNTDENPLIYIVKPSASSCGRGIELHRGVPRGLRVDQQMVCQRYIGNPLLIFGRKFDLRLYCVVTSFDPLRIYLFDEGLVRFAAEKYPGAGQDLENVHKHLTNYSVNKTAELNRESRGKDYDSDDPLDIKWCTSDFRKHLETHHPLGAEAWERIRRECDDVVVKTFLSIENDVVKRIRCECRDTTGRCCFELFGLDLMADDTLKVRLIEVNIMPSLATGSNLDKAVKSRMLAHMLTLVRAIPVRRSALPKERKRREPRRAVRAPSPKRWRLPFRCNSETSTGERGDPSPSDGARRGQSRTSSTGAAAAADDGGAEESSPVRRRANGSSGSDFVMPPGPFVPYGAEADRPERTYRFGQHPHASAHIIEKPLLTAFNVPDDPQSTLTPYETLMVVEAEEELRCAGGFRRIFPVSSTLHSYLPLFTHGVRRNNYVLCSAVCMRDKNRPKMD